jgi:hypothetical protein
VTRAAALAGCALFVAVAVGNGFDRIAASYPARAPAVPRLFAAQSLGPRGDAALLAHDPATAATLGARYVDAAPLDPSASALLGAGRLVAGDPAGAEAAFRVAGQLGWRVGVTQRYWLARALQLGDWRVGAQRLDALLRQQPTLVKEVGLLLPFEVDPAGRAELLARMALRPDWLGHYAADQEDLPDDAVTRRAGVLIDLARAGVAVGCPAARQLVAVLVARGAVGVAQQLWRAQCGGGPGLIHDPHFAQASLTEAQSPLEWEIGASSDLELAFSADSGPRQLTVRGPARAPQLIARQFVVLAPGRYRVSWRSAAGGGIEAGLGCRADNPTPLPASFNPASGRWQAELTADAACAGRWLSFSIRPGVNADSLGEVSLDKL